MSRHFNWSDVLRELGIAVTSGVLPQQFKCPFCDEDKFYVYRDTILNSEWYHCRDCNWAGNSIHLLSKYHNLSINTILLKYGAIKSTSDARLDTYLLTIEKRDDLIQLWHDSQNSPLFDNSKVIKNLQHEFGLTCGLDQEKWASRLGKFLGASNRVIIDSVCRPCSDKALPGRKVANTGRGRYFVGLNWTDVLMIPFYDMPGRINGFYFIGRDGGPKDHFYRKVGFKLQDGRCETGVGMLSVLWSKNVASLGSNLFVFEDPIAAIKLHANHFKDNSRTLPLICVHATEVAEAIHLWKYINTGKSIFCGPEDRVIPIVRQAFSANGNIARMYDRKDFCTNMYRKSPTDWLFDFERKSKHWREFLEEYIETSSKVEIEEVMYGLELSTDRINNLVDSFGSDAATKLKDIMLKSCEGRTIRIGDRYIAESNSKLVFTTNEEVFFDALLRVDKIVSRPSLNAVFYKGRIIFEHKEYPFFEQDINIRTSTGEWMRNFMLKQGKWLIGRNKNAIYSILDIATCFHRPEMDVDTGVYGWDTKSNSFDFPSFNLSISGDIKVKENSFPVVNFSPMANVTMEDITQEELDQLFEDTTANKLTWAIASVIVANTVAPVILQPTMGVSLTGYSASNLGPAIAKELGCNTVSFIDKDWKLASFLEQIDKHKFPTVVEFELPNINKRKAIQHWIGDSDERNCFLATDVMSAKANLINGNWCHIHSNSGSNDVKNKRILRKLIPHLLKEVCSNRFDLKFVLNKDNTTLSVIIDILTNLYKSDVVKSGTDLIESKATDKTIGELVKLILEIGEVPFIYLPYFESSKLNAFVCMKNKGVNEVFIPKAIFNHMLSNNHCPTVNVKRFSNILTANGIKVKDIIFKNNPGWLVKERDWNNWI